MTPPDLTGNVQAFILATIAFLGIFAYAIALVIVNRSPDPVVFPVIGMVVISAAQLFFSSHIANGAAGKALDALVQTGKDRETAVAEATKASNGGS